MTLEHISRCDSINSKIEIQPINGLAPFNYLWSNGTTESSISQVPAGVYSVTITSSNGATGLKSVMVLDLTMPPELTVSESQISLSCQNPQKWVYASGNGSFFWSNGLGNLDSILISTSTSEINLISVILTDSLGCTNTSEISINYNEPKNLGFAINPKCTPLGLLLSWAYVTADGVQIKIQQNEVNAPLLADTLINTGVYQIDDLANNSPYKIELNYQCQADPFYSKDTSLVFELGFCLLLEDSSEIYVYFVNSNDSFNCQMGSSFFPNPSSNWMVATLSPCNLPGKLTLYTAEGKFVQSQDIQKFSSLIVLPSLQTGTYYMEYKSSNGRWTEAVLIKDH